MKLPWPLDKHSRWESLSCFTVPWIRKKQFMMALSSLLLSWLLSIHDGIIINNNNYSNTDTIFFTLACIRTVYADTGLSAQEKASMMEGHSLWMTSLVSHCFQCLPLRHQSISLRFLEAIYQDSKFGERTGNCTSGCPCHGDIHIVHTQYFPRLLEEKNLGSNRGQQLQVILIEMIWTYENIWYENKMQQIRDGLGAWLATHPPLKFQLE